MVAYLPTSACLQRKSLMWWKTRAGSAPEGHSSQRALEHGRKQRGADSLPGDVGNDKGGAVIAHGKHIKIIAAHRVTGSIDGGNGQVRKIAEAARQERLLNFPGDTQFLLEALALALAFHQARVVQNAGGFDGQGIENLAVKFGKGRGPPRIQIENAQKLAALNVDDRFRGARARHGVERDRHDGAQALRNDALRPLKRDIGLLKVSRDHAGLAIHRHAQGGLRGREAFRRHGHASGAPGEAVKKRSVRSGLEQKAAFGVGDGNGAVQHGFEHGVERKLRMQQHGRFEKQIEFAEADGRRFGCWKCVPCG